MFPGDPTSRSATDGTRTEPMTVELYVRSLSASGAQVPQESVIERLSRLECEGCVEEYTVHVWGKRISPEAAAAETDTGEFVLERIEAFEAWAERTGMSVGSFFDTHEVDSAITDQSYSAITVPTMTLAAFRDDRIEWVAPCTDGEAVYTVDDGLDAIEAAADERDHETGEGDRAARPSPPRPGAKE
jgi:hypothetical protein